MAAPKHDYYETLGISKKASADEVRKSYRKLARKYHPDLNPGDKSAEERFKNVQEAYDILSDPKKRQMYDQFGFYSENGFAGAGPGQGAQGGPPPGMDFSGFDFSDYFSGQGQGGPLQPQRRAKRLDRRVGRGLVPLHHTEVVPGERVLGIHLHRLAVGGQRIVGAARLVQHDSTLVPQLGRVGHLAQQRVVQLERRGEVVLQQVHLRHRLQRQPPVLAPLQRQAILPQRLVVVALLPEGEPEVVVRQLVPFHHLREYRLALER